MKLFLDLDAQALVISPISTRRCLPPIVTGGDKLSVTVNFLQRNPQPLNTGAPVYLYKDESAASVVLSVGPIQRSPAAGSFVLAFGANSTPALPYNVDAISLSNALNSLASVVAAGGVTVLGNVGGPFRISFTTFGIQSLFTCPTNSLYPASSVLIATSQVGSAALSAVQSVAIGQNPLAQISSWSGQSAAAITVSSIQANVIQRISIPAGTYGGSFTLTLNSHTTAAIPWDAQMDVMQAAIAALPDGTGATVWPGQNYWDITIPANTYAFTGSATGLVIPLNLTGTLDLSSQAVLDLFSDRYQAILPLFITSTVAGATTTLYEGELRLNAPLQL